MISSTGMMEKPNPEALLVIWIGVQQEMTFDYYKATISFDREGAASVTGIDIEEYDSARPGE